MTSDDSKLLFLNWRTYFNDNYIRAGSLTVVKIIHWTLNTSRPAQSVHFVWLKLRPNVSGGRLHLHHNTNYVSLALVHKLGLVVRNRITGVRGKWKISVFRRNKLITLYAEMKKIHNRFPETSPIKQFRKNSFDIFPNLIVTREWKHFFI